ncbi:MAG: hypothetical protein K6G60_10150 [Lachnospiraceae bacterium]|nr:hypothetical protein [Lachnospiraceae bacterium]
MMRRFSKTQINTVLAILTIIFAASLRQIPFPVTPFVKVTVAFLRPVIYVTLFSLWGISIGKRIVHEKIKNILMIIAALMVFWICARTVKYNSTDLTVIRYSWYLYYVSQIFIPTLFFIVAFLLDKQDRDVPGGKIITRGAFGVSAVLLLLVLTNDLHRLVFVFGSKPYTEKDYTHAFVFYMVWGWMVLLGLYSIVAIVSKCRVYERKKFAVLPLIAISLAFLYAVLSMTGNPLIKKFAGDMSVSFSVIYMFIIESCLQSGLIRINTGYKELFENSTIRAQILDEAYNTYLTSGNAVTYPIETLRETEWGPVLLEDGIRLSNFRITGGHFLWQEDTTELFKVMQELDEAKRELEGRNAVLAEAFNTERNIRRLEEQNRLYDSIQKKTRKQINMLSKLLKEYRSAETHDQRTAILKHIIVVGVYIKRRNNLIFINEQSNVIPVRELELCFEETVSNLELADIRSSCFINAGDEIALSVATEMYDLYEKICEEVYGKIDSMLIRIYLNEDGYHMSMDVNSLEPLQIKAPGAKVTEEDGVYCISARFDRQEVGA